MTTPNSDLQQLNQTSGFVELYTLDCSAIGGAVYNFTNTCDAAGSALIFGSTAYTQLPIVTDGWDFAASGAPAKPSLSVSNVSKSLLSAVISLGDIVGAKVTRIRTFEKYLATGSSPDGSKFLGPDVYIVEQKTLHNKQVITWQLTSIIDRMGMYIPRRQCLKDKGFPGVSRSRIL
jgi:lambda family phage minor tail protein L